MPPVCWVNRFTNKVLVRVKKPVPVLGPASRRKSKLISISPPKTEWIVNVLSISGDEEYLIGLFHPVAELL